MKVVLAVTLLVSSMIVPHHSDLRVTDLETEHAAAPIAVAAAKPRLGWLLRATRKGQKQTAYQIQISQNGRQVWDSGRVASERHYDIRYSGPALRPATRYTWRVKAADMSGDWSGWSSPTWFETAPGEVGGAWIGAATTVEPAPDLAGTTWIWYPEGDPASHAPAATRYFRRTWELASVPATARLVLGADDGFTAWVNGVEVGSRDADPVQENWRRPIVVDVKDKLRQGVNTIAVKAANGRPGPAGLLGRLEGLVDTDRSWRTVDTEPPAGWTSTTFDDSSWVAAKELATWGSGPWGRVVPERPTLPEPLLRRTFAVGKTIAQARLHAAAGGYVELTLNGRRVGDQVLQPGFTRYDKRVQYVTHDVTRLLHRGGNVIGARLGRGFYGMTQQNVWNWHSPDWNGEPRLKAQLVITYTDGSTESITTDQQWRFAEGPVRFDSLYGGETYDARLEIPGWDTPAFDASAWAAAKAVPAPKGELVPQEQEPIKVVATHEPAQITEPKPGTYVYKLPRNIAGWARIRTDAPEGTKIRLKYGERLNADGTVLAESGHVTGRFQIDEYIAKGGQATWEARYTYKGFQYVEVTGARPALQGREVHTALTSVGTFRSSNPLFEQVRTMTRQTVVNNWHDIPTDTPMYEKNGWTGDAQLMAEMEMAEYDLRRLFTKWMTDHRDSLGADGLVPAIVPDNGWGLGPGWHAPPWHASFTVIPWIMYERYGDRDLLDDNYPDMRKYLDNWLKRGVNGLYPSTLNDYLAPGYGGNSPEDMRLAGTAYTYSNALLIARAAEVLGFTGDAARFRAEAATMKQAFNREFLRGDAYVTATDPGYRQTSALIALALGLAPEEQEKAITDRLVRDITERGGHLNTGALGTKYLLTELTKRGHGELAYRVATQRTYPSWGYWVDNGATTLWERWDTDARSRDHVFLGGAIGEWFFEDLAGLTVRFDRITIAPKPLGDLRFAEASTATVHGQVSTRWRRADGRFILDVTVPVGALASVELPSGARHEVGSGAHTFTEAA